MQQQPREKLSKMIEVKPIANDFVAEINEVDVRQIADEEILICSYETFRGFCVLSGSIIQGK